MAAARRPLRARPVAGDVGLVVALLGASAAVGWPYFIADHSNLKMIAVFGSFDAWRVQVLVWWLLTAVSVVALFFRRQWPLTVFVICAVAAGWHLFAWPTQLFAADLAAPIALYSLASAARPRRLSLGVAIAAVVGCWMIVLASHSTLGMWSTTLQPAGGGFFPEGVVAALSSSITAAAVPVLLLAAAWFAGDASRERREHVATLEARSRDLAREQEQRLQLAAAAERGRIARDLHDVVAHGLSMMIVQTQAASAVLKRDPDEATSLLVNVVAAGRRSMTEIRALLLVARENEAISPQLEPQPSLEQLDALAATMRAAGIDVTLEIHGDRPTLPALLDLSAYRIIQEALTNAVKHAGSTARSTVRLTYRPTEIDIDVENDIAATPHPIDVQGNGVDDHGNGVDEQGDDHGNGLRGIAERVAAFGGSFEAGAVPGDGFRLHVTLPLEAKA